MLTAQFSAAHILRDAYEAKTLSLSAGLERQTNIFFQKTWTWSLGGELLTSDERDVIESTGQPRRRTFFIGALPTSLNYDGSDDLLNPTRGFRLGGRLSPEVSLQGSVFGYTRTQIDASLYHPFGDRVVLAARTRLGTILGAPRDQIAPSRRFYAGGGARCVVTVSRRSGRAMPTTIRSAGEAWPNSQSRRGSRHSAISASCPFGCGQYLHLAAAAPDRLALRHRAGRALLFQFRADPPRRRHTAQSAKGR